MNLKLGLIIILLFSTAVFVGGVIIEQRAEPGSAETVLGINPESPGLVTAAVVLSLFLAVAILLRLGTLIAAVAALAHLTVTSLAIVLMPPSVTSSEGSVKGPVLVAA